MSFIIVVLAIASVAMLLAEPEWWMWMLMSMLSSFFIFVSALIDHHSHTKRRSRSKRVRLTDAQRDLSEVLPGQHIDSLLPHLSDRHCEILIALLEEPRDAMLTVSLMNSIAPGDIPAMMEIMESRYQRMIKALEARQGLVSLGS